MAQEPSLPTFDQLLVLARFAPAELDALQKQVNVRCAKQAVSEQSRHQLELLLFYLRSSSYQQQAPMQRLNGLFGQINQSMMQLQQCLPADEKSPTSKQS